MTFHILLPSIAASCTPFIPVSEPLVLVTHQLQQTAAFSDRRDGAQVSLYLAPNASDLFFVAVRYGMRLSIYIRTCGVGR